MKNRALIVALFINAFLLAACNGDHSSRVVKDTVKNRYGTDTAKVEKSNIDTSKVTSTTGDASSLDNSASGGTKTARDSSKKKNDQKK